MASRLFTVTSAAATVGATYRNNGVTFTVQETIAAGTLLRLATAAGLAWTPVPGDNTLTKVSGTGDATIKFSSYTNLNPGFDTFGSDTPGGAFSSPALHALAVTPSDTAYFNQVARAIYVGVAGDITLVTPNGEAVLFSNAPVGILPVMCIRVNSTGTTATNMVSLW